MPLAGTPAPTKKKRTSRIITKTIKDAGTEINFGKKISIPRDVMLEELSLLKNKGSLMFKERQRRVERFIYESNPDVFNPDSMDNYQKFLPGSGVVLKTGADGIQVIGQMGSGVRSGYSRFGTHSKGTAPAPYPKHQHHAAASGITGKRGSGQAAGGTGGLEGSGDHGGADGGKEAGGTGKKHITILKTYVSPWEQAMGNDPELKATMSLHMASPSVPSKQRSYKSFNRTAMPYGGFEKAAKLMTFQLPEFDTAPPEPEPVVVFHQGISCRPNFNRTPLGWTPMSTDSLVNLGIDLELNAETDDL
ncbi:myozenin-1-like isoform X2 [Carcharodon carcharias]|uniref:myozenin-1-like isoform X2 n=1 Tax=Carcharodon carcharias TaxID=13397 RepID=UPI001B7DF584|nr:myozenin-1-like isoform X2 [Carcharodon carcharias]